MKRGLALAFVGLWVILQTTKGPLAEKLGLIASSSSSGPPPGSASTPQPGAPDYGVPGLGGRTFGAAPTSPNNPNLGTGGAGAFGSPPNAPNYGLPGSGGGAFGAAPNAPDYGTALGVR